MVGISNQVGMTILEVDGGTESPRLPLTHHLLGGNGGSYWGLGWKDRGLGISRAIHRVVHLSVRRVKNCDGRLLFGLYHETFHIREDGETFFRTEAFRGHSID